MIDSKRVKSTWTDIMTNARDMDYKKNKRMENLYQPRAIRDNLIRSVTTIEETAQARLLEYAIEFGMTCVDCRQTDPTCGHSVCSEAYQHQHSSASAKSGCVHIGLSWVQWCIFLITITKAILKKKQQKPTPINDRKSTWAFSIHLAFNNQEDVGCWETGCKLYKLGTH